MPKIRPSAGHAILEPIIETHYGSILFPETAFKEAQSQYRVVAVGKPKPVLLKNGSWLLIQPAFGRGHTVVAGSWAGRPVEVDGKPMRLVEFESVMAVIEHPDPEPPVSVTALEVPRPAPEPETVSEAVLPY